MSADRRSETLAQLQPYIARAKRISGWTHVGLRVRRLDPDEPWDYEAIARDGAASARSVLDMGTGGGEVLSRIVLGVEARAVATEGWPPNAPVARDRLAPLGVDVVLTLNLELPFADAAFDAVLNRHEELTPHEVARVLRPGGRVVTQQAGPFSWPELSTYFAGRRHEFGDLLAEYAEGFASAGLLVERAELYTYRVAFEALGDLVYMLLVTPWDIADFDPAADIDALLALEDGLRTPDGIVLTEQRSIIIATKPA